MRYLLAGVIFLAIHAGAQPGGNCAVADCPENFLPRPVTPSAAERQKVATALAAANSADEHEATIALGLKTRYDDIRSELMASYRLLPRGLAERIVTAEAVRKAALSDREYLLKQEDLRTAVAETYRAHNAAILEAVIVYQLAPPVGDFTGDPRAASANMVDKPWLPHYSRHEKLDDDTGLWRRRNEKDLAKEGQGNSIVGGSVASANTRNDGVMEFYGQAFSSPEELAVNLFHETSHWVEIAGKSGGFTRSDLPEVSFRTEQRAYSRAAIFAVQLGANPQWHQKMAAQFELQADQSRREKLRWDQVSVRHPNWIGKDRIGSLAMAPVEPELAPDDETLLQVKMAEAQTLVKEDRDRRELMAEQERQRTALPAPVELNPTIPDSYPSGYRPAEAIKQSPFAETFPDLAQYAVDSCRQPGSGHSPHMNYFQRPYMEFYGEREQWESWYQVEEEKLQGCAKALFKDFVDLALEQSYWKALDQRWLETQVSRYSPSRGASGGRSRSGDGDGGSVPPTQSHEPVWKRVGPIIGR